MTNSDIQMIYRGLSAPAAVVRSTEDASEIQFRGQYAPDLLKGDKGDPGDPGDPGEAGKTAYEVAVETGFVGTEEEWVASLDGAPGADGADGADGSEVELQTSATHVQWRYVGDPTWTDLVLLADITGADGADGADGAEGAPGADGADGSEIELQTTATHIQWRLVGGTWADLVALADLQGPQGVEGIQGPQGDPGIPGETGPAGPSTPSSDADNSLTQGTDNLLYLGPDAYDEKGAAVTAVSEHDLDAKHFTGTQEADLTAAKSHANSPHNYDPAGTAASAVSAHDTDSRHFSGTQEADLTTAKAHADSPHDYEASGAAAAAVSAHDTTAKHFSGTQEADLTAAKAHADSPHDYEASGAAVAAVSAHDTDAKHFTGTQEADLTAAKAHADSPHSYDPAGTAASAVSAHDTDAKHFTGTQEQDLTDAKAHAGVTTGNPHNVTAADLSLGNVDNTSDADKPVSSATQTALNLKADTGAASPQSAITDLTSLTLDQSVHVYTSASADVLSATALAGGWSIIYISSMDTVTADAGIEWIGGTDINDLAAGTELLLRSDGTTVFASVGVPT